MIKFNSGASRGKVRTHTGSFRGGNGFSGFGGGGMGGTGGFSGFGGNGMCNGPSQMSSGGSQGSHNQELQFTPVMDLLDEGSVLDLWLSRAPERLHRLFRRIYYEDNVAGPAVELYKDLPWSPFQLVGIEDPTILKFYTDALNAIHAEALLPEITQEFLVMGKTIGHMIMDERAGYFTNVIVHDPDRIRVTPSQVPGLAPKLDLLPSPMLLDAMMSEDARDQQQQQILGPFADMIRNNKEIPLHPANSFYLARRMAPYDSIGASVYTRILHLVAYEKALINATLTTANRRNGRIRQMILGEEGWEPNEEEVEAYLELFMEAERDPYGGVIATRTGVNVTEVGGNTLGDIIKMSDEWEYLSKAKMNALGVSDTFLTGEASYNSMEQVLSIFLDRVRAHREYVTQRLLIDQILKPLAKKHGFKKIAGSHLAHRIRVAPARVANSEDRSDFILPGIVFEKKLRPTGDATFLDILSTLEDKGFPITLRTWAAVGGLDLQTEIDQQDEDLKLRAQFAKQKRTIETIESGSSGGGGDEDGGGDDFDFGGDGEGDDLGDDLGGDDLGDDLGGDDAGGDEGAFELGASANNFDVARDVTRTLPHFSGKDVFLGITREEVQTRAAAVLRFVGGRKDKPMNLADQRRILSVGNKSRDYVLAYLLARAGVLTNVHLPEDIHGDIVKTLCTHIPVPEVLVHEVQAALAMRAVEETKKAPKRAARPTRQVGILGDKNDSMLLTGYRDRNDLPTK